MKMKKLAVVSLMGMLVLTGCNKVRPAKPLVEDWTGDFSEVAPTADLAQGVKNFAPSSADDRKEILRLLESYTLDNFLGGIPYRDNSGYVLYNSRLDIPSNVFVPGYGYGVGEAEIKSPLTHNEITVAHNMYYHTWTSSYPSTLNYLNGQDSVTSDLHSLVSASYWSTKFNDDKSGYDWYPSLAMTDRPVALNPDGDGMATKWRVKVKTTANTPELKYHTLSAKPAVAAFDEHAVALDDYLTPFKLMLNQKWFRATDLGSQSSGFKGVNEYLAAANKNWDNVGIQLNVEESAIEFEFNSAKTPFYAMYNLSSSLFTPIPQAFVDTFTDVNDYGNMDNAQDNILSLGVYAVESVVDGKEIVFKKNPHWLEKDRYSHAGYKYTILKDANVAFEEFLAGKLDGVGVPSASLQEYKTDPRARQTLGDTVWKLQVNATDPTRWDELFGEEGAISPGSEWDLKPVMSNRDFLNGLYYSIDRAAIALETGSRPAPAFLSDAYMIDPEEGESWRSTDEGKSVLKDRSPGTHGYSEELAKSYFASAMEDLVEKGVYKVPNPRKPETIEIQLIFQTQTQVDTEGKTLERYIEGAFNEADTGFKLDVKSYATSDWMDAYYAAMFGEFDLAFGSISGNTLDPIDFMDTVMSNNVTGFTLSWGIDTSVPSSALKFKDEYYSFNALQRSATGMTVVKNGRNIAEFGATALDGGDVVDGEFDLMIGGVYYDEDPNFELEIIDAYIEFWVPTGDDTNPWNVILADVVADIEAEDGEWVVSFEGVEEPADAVYMDVTIEYTKTLGDGFPEVVQYVLELYSPSFDPAA